MSGSIRRRQTVFRTWWLLVLVAALATLGACGDGDGDGGGEGGGSGAPSEAPEGYRVVRHPGAEVAVPDDWEPVDEPVMTEGDPDAVELEPQGLTGVSLGAWLWRHDAEVPEGFIEVPVNEMVVSLYGTPGYEELRNERVEIAGAEEAHLVEVRAQGTALDGEPEVFFTYVSARAADGSVMVLRLAGPREHVSTEAVETALDTFRVTDG